ncbi:glycosyltransferase [Patescibacteria group bacterium]|nr:glycosyltransferase [Patescibacteria group bacterium]
MIITVVVVTYNEERDIDACLTSLLNQSRKPNEIIVVDDGSSDNTVKKVTSYPVSVIRVRHTGRCEARNIGWKNAKGDVICFAEADSVFDKDWVFEIEKSFLCGADTVTDRRRYFRPRSFLQKVIDADFIIRYQNYTPFSAWAFKKKVLQATQGYNKYLDQSEEKELHKRVLSKGFKTIFAKKAVQYHKGEPKNFFGFIKRVFDSERKRASGYLILFPDEVDYTKIALFFLNVALFGISIYNSRYVFVFFIFVFLQIVAYFLKIYFVEKGYLIIPLYQSIGLTMLRFLRTFTLVAGFIAGLLDRKGLRVKLLRAIKKTSN